MLTVWDTSHAGPGRGFAYWRECVTQAYLPLEPEVQSVTGFNGRIARNGCDSLKVSRVLSSRSVISRTASGIAARSDGVFFANLILSGTGHVLQDGRTALARPGDVIVVDTDRTFSLDFREGVDLVCVAFDGSAMRRSMQRCRGPADLVIGGQAAGRLVAAYMAALAENLEAAGPIADLAAEQFPALVAHAAVTPEPKDARSASLAARIRQFVESRIGEPDLGAKHIAAALGTSRTVLYETMAAQGMTVAGFILDRRLRGCIAEFASGGPGGRPVADIAAEWGFRDAAAFSRTFKRVTGTPPGAYRRRLDMNRLQAGVEPSSVASSS